MIQQILIFAALVVAYNFPSRVGPINDFAGIISSPIEEKLSALALEIEQKSGFALVVAAINPDEEVDIEDYSNRLYESWGVGKKDKNEGALLLILPAQRRVRIEVGYGAEGFITDAVASQIINERIVPAVRANGLEEGVLSGTLAIAAIVVKHYNLSLSDPILQRNYGNKMAGRESVPLPVIIVMIILLAIAVSTRTGRGILLGMLLSRAMGGGGRIGSSGFGGRIGGGGFSGGFGGFGGGLSGGGGASGRW